jgi:hypothetical protein
MKAIPPVLRRSKSGTPILPGSIQQAMERLGSAYHVIEKHQPSLLLVKMNLVILFGYFLEEHSCDNNWWQPIEIFRVQERFSKMPPNEIENLLNNLNKVDSEKYQLLKNLLTGHETDESDWIKWIDEISNNLPSPYDIGQLRHQIQLSKPHQEIIARHQSKTKTFSKNDMRRKLSVFYHTCESMPGYVFPIPKSGLKEVLDQMSNEDLRDILDILSSMNFGVYESFKRIITNHPNESVIDHKIYDKGVRKFICLVDLAKLNTHLFRYVNLSKLDMHIRYRKYMLSCHEVFNFVKRHPSFLIIIFVFVMFYLI